MKEYGTLSDSTSSLVQLDKMVTLLAIQTPSCTLESQFNMGIKVILVVNNHGQPRLLKFYEKIPFSSRESVVGECFNLVSKRSDSVCNFLEGSETFGKDVKLIYRHYATLYFIFAVDEAESELGILDLIQVFVESLDKCFENVCELDLIFHTDKVHYILDEIVMGGMVLETSLKEIITAVNGTIKYQRASKDQHKAITLKNKK